MNANGNLVAEYTWGLLGPLMRRLSNVNNIRYYIQDGLGHTRALLDNAGNVTDRYVYEAWGGLNNSLSSTPTANPFRWNGAYGYEWIPITGLYHVGAREYDPRVGRWLQRDPIEVESGDPHLYRYCGNDPINCADSTGTKAAIEVWDFVPLVGSARDVYQGARDGDWVQFLFGMGGLAVDAFTFGAGSIGKGVAKGAGRAAVNALRSGAADPETLARVGAQGAKAAAQPAKSGLRGLPGEGGVYVLRDQCTNEVVYVGRTNNLARRAAEHGRDDIKGKYQFEVESITNDYAAQRGREQIVYDAFGGPLLNKIRPISAKNKQRLEKYLEAGFGLGPVRISPFGP